MPFADYQDFDACKRANSDKRDPGAYCAAIKRQAEKLEAGELGVDEKASPADLPEPVPLSEHKLEDWELDYLCVQVKAWVPYVGPQGGEGWQNTSTGEVVYQDEPPGGEEAVGEGWRDAGEQEMLDAVAEVFDEESARSMEEAGLSADEIRQAVQEAATAEELAEVAEAVGAGGTDGAVAVDETAPDGPLTGEELDEGDDVVIDGEEATVSTVKDMGGGWYVAGETDDGEVVTARVGPDHEFEPAEEEEPSGATITASEVSEGDTVVIEGTEGEVTKVSDMGGGFYIAAESDDGEVLTARVGPDVEFETEAEEPPEPEDPEGLTATVTESGGEQTVTISGEGPGEMELTASGLGYPPAENFDPEEGEVMVQNGRDGPQVRLVDDGFNAVYEPDTEEGRETLVAMAGGDPDVEAEMGDRLAIEGEGEVEVRDVRYDLCEPGETQVKDANGRKYCVVGEDVSPGGPEAERKEPSDYELSGGFDEELAEAATSGEVLGTDDIYRNMGKVDDPELVADVLELELRGDERKTAVDRLESKLGTFDEGPSVADVKARLEGPSGGGGVTGLEDYDFEELREALEAGVQAGELPDAAVDHILLTSSASKELRRKVREELGDEELEALGERLDGWDDGYPGPFDDWEEELDAVLSDPSRAVGSSGFRGQRKDYDLERIHRLHEHADTETLEQALEEHRDDSPTGNDYDDAGQVVAALLHYRDDSDVGWEEASQWRPGSSGTADPEDVRQAATEAFDELDPAVGVLTMQHIQSFQRESLSGNTIGVWRSSSQALRTDQEDAWGQPSTIKHEIGHAVQYAIGVTGRSSRDNTDKSSRDPDRWDFDVNVNSGAGEPAEALGEELETNIDRYLDRADRHGPGKVECRTYQRTNTNEVIAVSFAHWMEDRSKLEAKHPELAAMWDDHVGGGVQREDITDSLPDENTGDIEPIEVGADKGDRVDVVVDGEEYKNVEFTGANGYGFSAEAGPERIDGDWSDVESMHIRRPSNDAREADLAYEGADVEDLAEDPDAAERILSGHELTVEHPRGEYEGMTIQEATDQTLWLRDPEETGPASEVNVPWDEVLAVEAYEQ